MDDTQRASTGVSRRQFFGYAAALTGAGMLAGVTGCKKDEDNRVNMGTGNIALMNSIYAVEQLQAAFYLKVIDTPYTGITKDELELLHQLRDHELAHRGFLKVLLGTNGIPELSINTEHINLLDRYSVLSTARQLEDASVAAYNGIARVMDNTSTGQNYLAHLAKMAVVEARHAATIRELLEPDSFANTSILDPVNHLDAAMSPSSAMVIVDSYFYEDLNVDQLPLF